MALREEPGDANLYFLQAALASVQKQPDQAIAALYKAAEFARDDEIRQRVARAQIRLSCYRDARSTLQSLETPNPDQQLEIARCDWGMGRYSHALIRFRQLHEQQPGNSAAQLAFVQALISLGHTGEAVDALSAASADIHQIPALVLLESCRLATAGNISAAVALVKRSLRTQRGNPELHCCQLLLESLESGKPVTGSMPANNHRITARIASHNWLNTIIKPGGYCWTEAELFRRCIPQSPGKGLIMECGVFHGRSLNIIAAETTAPVYGFDSFEGLPEDWMWNEPKGSYSTGGKLPAVPPNVQLVQGWFEDTLPKFLGEHRGPVRLVHIDCDLYSSTMTILEQLTTRLQAGAILVFDDFLGFPGYEQHEFRAFHEWAEKHQIETEIQSAILFGRVVAFKITRNPHYSVNKPAR